MLLKKKEKKRKSRMSRPGPFLTVQSNLSSWRRWANTNSALPSAALTGYTVFEKKLNSVTHLPYP